MAYYLVRVEDDSLHPLATEGDHVVVLSTSAARLGDVVVARIAGEEPRILIRRLSDATDREACLESVNPAYPPLTIPLEEVQIIGIVVRLGASDDEAGESPTDVMLPADISGA